MTHLNSNLVLNQQPAIVIKLPLLIVPWRIPPNMDRFSVLLLSALMVGTNQSAVSKETITWIKWELVPEYIATGEFENQGYLDKFLKYTTALLPEYNHKTQFQTLNRIDKSWTAGEYCTLHLWLGYWPDKIIYSKPYGFTPRFGIIVRTDSQLAQRLGNRTSVSLRHLLHDTPYTMGILPLNYNDSNNSRYPQLVDIIAPYRNTEKVREFSNNKNEISIQLLNFRRADYIVRHRISHQSELKLNNYPNIYQHYYIEESLTYKLVAAACSNTTQGKAVISKLNGLIDDDFYKMYIKFRQEWDSDNTVFEGIYSDYFIHKKPNGNIIE